MTMPDSRSENRINTPEKSLPETNENSYGSLLLRFSDENRHNFNTAATGNKRAPLPDLTPLVSNISPFTEPPESDGHLPQSSTFISGNIGRGDNTPVVVMGIRRGKTRLLPIL